MMKSKSAQIIFHLFGCLIFLSLPVLLWPGDGGFSDFFADNRAVRSYLNDILILLFFYLNFYFLISKLYFTRKFVLYILVLLFCFAIIVILPGAVVPFPQNFPPGGHHTGNPGNRLMFSTIHKLGFFLGVTFFSLMLKINNRWKQAEKEKLKAELAYFKAQINPHFLFNTLNTIYSLAIQKADNTADAIVKLSGMMRYVISEANSDFVPLDKEISYISDYIELQRVRYDKTVHIDYKACEPDPGHIIAPLLLIPFIENAFKFGVNPEEDSSIMIELGLAGTEFYMHVFNNKVINKQDSDTPGGLGIQNARHRLELLYPEKHRLILNETRTSFEVNLYIMLS